jgi:hypothetical protein
MSGRETYRPSVSTSVDSILEDSFPASDPPSWTLGVEPPHAQGAREGQQVGQHVDDAPACACCGRPLGTRAVERAGARFCSEGCAATATAPDAASLR